MWDRTGIDVWLYSFFNLGARWGMRGQRHALAALPVYSYLKCIVYDNSLKCGESFRITLYSN
jgi:hypothetical protein